MFQPMFSDPIKKSAPSFYTDQRQKRRGGGVEKHRACRACRALSGLSGLCRDCVGTVEVSLTVHEHGGCREIYYSLSGLSGCCRGCRVSGLSGLSGSCRDHVGCECRSVGPGLSNLLVRHIEHPCVCADRPCGRAACAAHHGARGVPLQRSPVIRRSLLLGISRACCTTVHARSYGRPPHPLTTPLPTNTSTPPNLNLGAFPRTAALARFPACVSPLALQNLILDAIAGPPLPSESLALGSGFKG